MDDVGRPGAAGPKTTGWFRGRFDPSGRPPSYRFLPPLKGWMDRGREDVV